MQDCKITSSSDSRYSLVLPDGSSVLIKTVIVNLLCISHKLCLFLHLFPQHSFKSARPKSCIPAIML